MSIQEILAQYGIVGYGISVFFGGRWGLKYFTYFRKVKYNFLVFATFWAALWMVGEYMAGTFKAVDLVRYLLTYTVVTSCYELVTDWFPFLKHKQDTNEN